MNHRVNRAEFVVVLQFVYCAIKSTHANGLITVGQTGSSKSFLNENPIDCQVGQKTKGHGSPYPETDWTKSINKITQRLQMGNNGTLIPKVPTGCIGILNRAVDSQVPTWFLGLLIIRRTLRSQRGFQRNHGRKTNGRKCRQESGKACGSRLWWFPGWTGSIDTRGRQGLKVIMMTGKMYFNEITL